MTETECIKTCQIDGYWLTNNICKLMILQNEKLRHFCNFKLGSAFFAFITTLLKRSYAELDKNSNHQLAYFIDCRMRHSC